MAARLWRCIVGLDLALAATAGAWLSGALSWSVPAASAVALGLLLAAPAAIVIFSFVIAQAACGAGARWGARATWRALLNEIAGFTVAAVAMCRAARPRAPAPRHPAGQPCRPVLLLHGFLCNGRVWGGLARRLYGAGFGPIEAPDLEPLLADIEAQARRAAPELLALQRRCSGERVVIVAHSMGGLVARALLRDHGAGVIRRVVTIASPHHGTALVRGLSWPNTRQMSDASLWLDALNTVQENRFAAPVASIYSLDDNVVVPAGSARLQGAELHALPGIGHLGMLRSRRALDCVIATLAAERPG